MRKLEFSVQFSCSVVSDSATIWTAACQASLSNTNSWSLLKLISIESVMPSNHLILLPSIFPRIRVFSNESALHIRWPEYWSFSFNISPSNEYSGLISFRIDWFDLFAVQGSHKSLLQHCSSKEIEETNLYSVIRSVVSYSLGPHELQHARPPCPSPTPGVHSDSRPLSPWCHPAISSSVIPFSSCLQSLPASESFPMSQLFAWGAQSTGVSGLASFLPKKSQGWSPSGWTGWISLQSKGLSRVFSNTTVQKHQFLSIDVFKSKKKWENFMP